jgi:ubiquinone/menaquinone biosynthesis C-methylase UbiE
MKIRSMMSVLIFSTTLTAYQDLAKRTPEELHRLHRDSKALVAFLEDPQRDAYQKPQEVVAALDLQEGEAIADIGAGSGYFSLRFARHAGERGRVYAIDTDPDMIRYMNRRIRDLNLRNIVTILSDPDDPLLPNAAIDLFFLCNTWHHIEHQPEYLALMRRMLRPRGQVAMIDFQKRDLPVGPPVEMKIAREDLVRQMESNGFGLTREYTFLPYQYFLVFALK